MDTQTSSHFNDSLAGYSVSKYLTEHMKFPKDRIIGNDNKAVAVKFIINEDGTLSDHRVLVHQGPPWDKEALRLARSMPPWKPVYQNTIPIKAMDVIIISFHVAYSSITISTDCYRSQRGKYQCKTKNH